MKSHYPNSPILNNDRAVLFSATPRSIARFAFISAKMIHEGTRSHTKFFFVLLRVPSWIILHRGQRRINDQETIDNQQAQWRH
jgi:hypothetical protein